MERRIVGVQQFVERRDRGRRQRDLVLAQRGQLGELVEQRRLPGELRARAAGRLEGVIRARETGVDLSKASIGPGDALPEPGGDADHEHEQRTSRHGEVQEHTVHVGVQLRGRCHDGDDAIRIGTAWYVSR